MERDSREFTSDLQQLAAMRDFLREVCGRAWGTGGDDQALHQLELALNEAAANVIRHGYGGEPGRSIEFVIEAGEEQAVVALYHSGQDFDPDAVRPPIFDGSREGGFGVYLIRKAVDEVTYFRDNHGRCGIRLVKKRKGARHGG